MNVAAQDALTGLIVSDFNTVNLSDNLNNSALLPAMEVDSAPYGQVVQTLLNPNLFSEKRYDFLVVWSRPEAVISSYNQLLEGKATDKGVLFEEVDSFIQLLISARENVDSIFVPLWVTPHNNNLFSLQSLNSEFGVNAMLMEINLRFIKALNKQYGIYLLNTPAWCARAGKHAFSSKMWYLSKSPFNLSVFKDAASTIKYSLASITGKSKKVIILDLDNTLWGGVVGDDGWQNLRLGGHDAVGEAFVDFQRTLKSLKERGVILAIVSKNEESVALDAIKKHQEMVLNIDDFAGWRINWEDKAQNILDLMAELNLGLDSAVYLDDNPVERDRVRKAVPEVEVPDLPSDVMLYKETLESLMYFNSTDVTDEDRKRTELYASQRLRVAEQQAHDSVEDWLMTLNTTVSCELLAEDNMARTVQLLNKTNQMNLTTRRMTEKELVAWSGTGDRRVWVFRVADKFSDLGITGIISLDITDDIANVADFILSCRIMGRKIEETMLNVLIGYAKKRGIGEVTAMYCPTEKNKPCLEFWKKSGFDFDGGEMNFSWDTRSNYMMPAQVSLINNC